MFWGQDTAIYLVIIARLVKLTSYYTPCFNVLSAADDT